MSNGNQPTDPRESTGARRLRFDMDKAGRDFKVVLAFAIIGFVGCVALFLLEFPPILVAVFLATGVASLVYGFLGGIQASFNLGPLQVTGSLAALLGCAWFVNDYLVAQVNARPFLEGYVNDLVEQPVAPDQINDPAKVMQKIAPENPKVIFAEWQEGWDPENGTKDLGWLLVPQEGTTAVVLEFQHHFEKWTRLGTRPPGMTAAAPTGSQCGVIRSAFQKQCGTESRVLVLDIEELRRRPGVRFIYRRHDTDPERRIGQLHRREPDGTLVPLEWASESTVAELGLAAIDAAETSQWLGVAYADTGPQRDLFGPDGSYDDKVGWALRQRLGQPGLKEQAYARDILVQNGDRSLRFIDESIEVSRQEEGYDRTILLHNLALALEEISMREVPVPAELQVRMADALYEIGDFEGAAAAYERAPIDAAPDPDILLRRAYALSVAGQLDKAVESYQQYLAEADAPEAQAIAHGNLAAVYTQRGDFGQAVEHFESAIAAEPEWPDFYNNLAWLYAERGVELERALELADRALELAPDDPSILDTKGWVLFRMGDLEAALEILERAAALAPYDPEIASHLETVRREIG